MDFAGKFLKTISPKISFGSDPMNEFSLSFNIDGKQDDESEILDLPEKIAKDKGLQIVVCIDEFQRLARFSDYERLENLMRSRWQHQQNTSYCLYGSQRHMMTEIFDSSEKPFYRFGQMYSLKKIEKSDWIKYILDRFEATGKQISMAYADRIVDTVERHSWYVQQLSSAVWNDTSSQVDEESFKKALTWCIDVNSESYRNICDSLSETQLCLLKAIANEESQLSSAEIMRNYRLGTSANVIKNKRILSRLDIINIENAKINFLDPIFKRWFVENYVQVTY